MEHAKGARLGRAFCSARFRDVPVLFEADAEVLGDEAAAPAPPSADPARPGGLPGATARPRRPDPDALMACLDYGTRCTGWLCPLFTVPTLPPENLLAEAMEAERRRLEEVRPTDPAAEG